MNATASGAASDSPGLLRGLALWYRQSPQERRDHQTTRPPWWGIPTNKMLHLATATLPKLLYERLDETGIDFSVIYPTLGLFLLHLEDEELRRSCCRALNTFHADIFHDYADRLTPVAVIPMHTPQEAIAELEYAMNTLQMKAILMAGHAPRPIAAVARTSPEVARYAVWVDAFGLDSEYDYDPVWAKCVELKVPPTFHSAAMGWGSRTSISTYMYNHIGHFAEAGEAICKALFFGGVTRRFPTLKFALLEGGVSTGARIYADLIARWKKRQPRRPGEPQPGQRQPRVAARLIPALWRHPGRREAGTGGKRVQPVARWERGPGHAG